MTKVIPLNPPLPLTGPTELLRQTLANHYAGSRIFMLATESTILHCLPRIAPAVGGVQNLPLFSLPDGEQYKNLNSTQAVLKWLLSNEASKNDLLLCLGGGVVTDLGGLVGSIYKRGMQVLYVPTTLLAMVDAAIGGKTGLDLDGFKNVVGTYMEEEPPMLPIPAFLSTLPEEELFSGWAEVLKHGLLDGEPYAPIDNQIMWPLLREMEVTDEDNWPLVISHSITFKRRIVDQDPHEHELRRCLNLGHTLGHALETYMMSKQLLMPHGHCVAAGLLMEGHVAANRGTLRFELFEQMQETIFSIFGQMELPDEELPDLYALARNDKKNPSANHVSFIELHDIGKFDVFGLLTKPEVDEAILWYFEADDESEDDDTDDVF